MKKYLENKQNFFVNIDERVADFIVESTIRTEYSKLKFKLCDNSTIEYSCNLPKKYEYLTKKFKKIMKINIVENTNPNVIDVIAQTKINLKKFIVPVIENGEYSLEQTDDDEKRILYNSRIIIS